MLLLLLLLGVPLPSSFFSFSFLDLFSCLALTNRMRDAPFHQTFTRFVNLPRFERINTRRASLGCVIPRQHWNGHRAESDISLRVRGVVNAAIGQALGQIVEWPMLGPTQLSNYLTLKCSFSAVSKPNFASEYALESSRRDLQNALLCTVLKPQIFVQKSLNC